MKQRIGKLLGKNLRNRSQHSKRLRGLLLESLEGRQLMAADFGSGLHNTLIAADVNQDFVVSPIDAMLVINAINSRSVSGSGEGETAATQNLYDVNNDGYVSPIDVLRVINTINAEGESGFLMSYTYSITDTSGNTLSSVAVGQTFRVNVFVQDTRDSATSPDSTPLGVFAAAMDLGVSNPDLATYQRTTSFFAGISFNSLFPNNRGGSEGGGLTVPGTTTASVSDGQVFSLNSGSGPIAFEFDWDGSVTGTNIAVTIRNPADSTPPTPLTFKEVGTAIALAINGSSLGVPAVYNDGPSEGSGVVGIDLDLVTFNSGTSGVFTSLVSDEYFNEVRAFQNSLTSPDPTGIIPVYSVTFVADAIGTITFNPNGPDRSGSENVLYGNNIVIPNDSIFFGEDFSINIVADPTAPIANTDNLTASEDVARTILASELLGNDTAQSGRTLSLVSISTTSGTLGTLVGNTYTSPANYSGPDVLAYTIQDSTGLTATGTINLTVAAVNDNPDAVNDSFTVSELTLNNTLSVLANDNAGPLETTDIITITAVGTPNNGGTVSIVSGGAAVRYTPSSTFVGTETFTYTITDAGGLSDTATVTVTVEATSRPRAVSDAVTINEDSAATTIDVLANDIANVGATKQLVGILTAPSNGTATINTNGTSTTSDDRIVYTPNANFFGTDTIVYQMTDSVSGSPTVNGTLTITVNPVNDPVVVTNDTATTLEDNVLTVPFATLLANDSPGLGEAASQTLTITSVTATSAGGTVAISGTNVVYTPATDFNGTFTFTYVASDQQSPASTATGTVTVTVTAINDAPIANLDIFSTPEDTPLDITFSSLLANDRPGPATATDETSQPLTITAVAATSATLGTVNVSGTTVRYTPPLDYAGQDTFQYTLSDGITTRTGTVRINVSVFNDPVVLANDTLSATEDTPLTIAASTLLANDSPGDGETGTQTLTITGVTATSAGGTVVLNGSNIVYTPAANFNGPFTFTYTARDNGDPVSSDTATVTINVAAVNDPPVAGADSATGTEDTVVTIPLATLLANDRPGPATATDESGQTLSITGVSGATNGSVAIVGTNAVFTPTSNFFGTAGFTYTLSDGSSTSTGNVTINIAAVNDPPVPGTVSVQAFSGATLNIPRSTIIATATAGPSNEDQTLTIISVSPTSNTNGTVVLNADQSISYTPNDDYIGPASFTYVIRDSSSANNQTTGTISVNVREFSPSTIGGTIWIDETYSTDRSWGRPVNTIDAAERRLGGVEVTLAGTSFGATVSMTVVTLADGSYTFDNVAPGDYVISYVQPEFLMDSPAMPDTHSFSIGVAGGITATDYNFAAIGIDTSIARTIEQLASKHYRTDSSLRLEGAYFSLDASNNLLWSALLDGYEGVLFSEATVVGSTVLFTVIRSDLSVETTTLNADDFVVTTDSSGNKLIRILGESADFSWSSVAGPDTAVSSTYLDAIDRVFAQEDWFDPV